MGDIITLDYGSGGGKTAEFIETKILKAFGNEKLNTLGDGAIIEPIGSVVFSTDSFVVSPLFFPGGDIGKLAVCGTVNDISMCGGEPLYLSLSFIIEEGLKIDELDRIIDSIANAAKDAGVSIVTGDTKVVERGRGDGIYINTAGIGALKYPGLDKAKIQDNDDVIISGAIGDHGATIMMSRGGLCVGDTLKSDCMPLNKAALKVLEIGGIRVLRDPTRGGVATTLNEFVEGTSMSIELTEELLPVNPPVKSACNLLGLDPLYCANEGKFLCICDPNKTDEVLLALKNNSGTENAALIGKVTKNSPGKVLLRTALGGSRILNKLNGALLPRIC